MSGTSGTHPVPAPHAETARVRKQDVSHPSALSLADVDILLAAVQEHAAALGGTLADRVEETERIESDRGDVVVYLGPTVLDPVFDAMELGDCVRRSIVRVAHVEAADAAGVGVPDEAVLVAESNH